jgi:hypothetical protein
MTELGFDCPLTVYSDSSSALQVVHKKGLGKLRHIALRQLFLQEAIAAGTLKVAKVEGKFNVADIGTKHQSAEQLARTRSLIGLESEKVVFSTPSVSMLEGAAPRVLEARYSSRRATTLEDHPLRGHQHTKDRQKIYFWPLHMVQ